MGLCPGKETNKQNPYPKSYPSIFLDKEMYALGKQTTLPGLEVGEHISFNNIARAAIQAVDDTMDGEDKNVFKER